MNSLENRMYCIRGAVCSENTADSLVKNVGELYQELCNKNELEAADIVSIQFSITPDLDALNPATALRKSDKTGATKNIPLFCCAEPLIQNMKPKVVRVMVTVYKKQEFIPVPVYLNGAESLRPDLCRAHTEDK